MASLQRWLGARPSWQIILFLIAATVTLRMMVVDIYPLPLQTYTPDCDANMFGAKTFAQGRLTNPPAPWHQFFILDYPSQMMKYQPAMAGIMAFGIIIFGHAHWGIVVAMALAIGISYWTLSGWVRKSFAFTAAVILMLIFRVPHYWVYQYSGGVHIFLASLLMLGAYPRVILHHRYRAIIPALVGLVLALLSRPFEGGMFALGLSICGIFALLRHFNAEQRKNCLRAIWLPTLLILVSYAAFQLYYNYRITGDAFELPYTLYHKKFDVAPLLTIGEPNYANDVQGKIKLANDNDMSTLLAKRGHYIEQTMEMLLRLLMLARFAPLFLPSYLATFIAAIFHLPLLYMTYNSITRSSLRPRYLPLLVGVLFAWSAFALNSWSWPHYMAPYFAALYVSFFVALDDLKLHPLVNWFLALLVIAMLIITRYP